MAWALLFGLRSVRKNPAHQGARCRHDRAASALGVFTIPMLSVILQSLRERNKGHFGARTRVLEVTPAE